MFITEVVELWVVVLDWSALCSKIPLSFCHSHVCKWRRLVYPSHRFHHGEREFVIFWFTVLWFVKPNKMKPMHKYVHSISLVCLYSILVFYKMSLLWPFPSGVDLSVRLTEAFIQSAGISYTGCSATWQREIIFTHRQLWLSGPRSAKKRFTQMARERVHGGWMMEGWFRHLLQASA